MNWFRWDHNDLLLQVRVQPGAQRSECAGLLGDALKLRIQAPPVDGRANAALVAYLGELFDLAKSRITVEQGLSGRSKVLRISAPEQLPAVLQELGLQRH